jgi:hypothetical protein
MTLGVALISFNRPGYFKKLIKSLESQVDTGDVEYHLFQDGAVNKFSHILKSDPKLIKQNVSVFKNSNLNNKTEHIHEMNVGNAINQFEAAEFMSSHYDYFLMIEDDLILSKHYIRLMRILMDQFIDKEDVFSVSLNFKRLCKKREIDQNLDKVVYKSLHWWAEGWSASKWKSVRKYFLQYYDLVKNCDYQKRPASKIKHLFHSNGLMIPQTSQDAGKDYALHKVGLKRINSVVNRGFYIGEKGMHFSPYLYKKMGYKSQKPYEFESDARINAFFMQ